MTDVTKGNVNSTSIDTADESSSAIGTDADMATLQLKKQARRRLIGAIALALFGVIALPMVMDSQPRPVAPEIQVHIPSQDGPGFTGKIVPGAVVKPTPMPPATVTPKSDPAVAKDPVSLASTAVDAAAAGTAAKQAEVKKPADPVTSKTSTAKAKQLVLKSAEPAKKTIEVASGDTRASDEPRALAALTGTESLSAPWTVQLGAYREAGNVKTLVTKVKEMKIPVTTEKYESAAGPRVRVRAGPFATRADAEKAQARIRTIGVVGVLSQ